MNILGVIPARYASTRFVLDARDEFGLDLAQSYMIGDKLIDLECEWNARVKRSILMRTSYGAELEKKKGIKVNEIPIFDDLSKASDWILIAGVEQ